MARGKRTINRKEQMVFEEDDKPREETEDEEEDDDDAEASDEESGDEESGDDDEESPKKKPKKKAKAKVVKPATTKAKRPRGGKVVRMRAIWGVFNNSNAMVAKFDFPQKQEAEEHAAKLREEKKATFFVIQVKEEMK